MTPVNFKVGEEEYQLLPHTGFEAMDLDRKVLGLVGKMARNGDLLEDDIYAMAALSTTLSDLGSSDYRWLVETTFRNVTVVTPGKKNVSLSDIDAVAEHFAGHMNDMYTALTRHTSRNSVTSGRSEAEQRNMCLYGVSSPRPMFRFLI